MYGCTLNLKGKVALVYNDKEDINDKAENDGFNNSFEIGLRAPSRKRLNDIGCGKTGQQNQKDL